MELILSHPFLIPVSALALSLIVWGMRAPRIRGKACIIDGDSIEINGQRLRLAGIDAPEYNQFFTHHGRVHHIGAKARKALSDLIGNRPVSCKVLGQDSYKRQVVICYNHKGQDVGHSLVLMGLAEVYAYRTRSRANRYRFAQFRAQFARRGLWATSGNSPQEWRKAQK